MIGHRIVVGRAGRDEAEKPFWISYADLMSALMVLFLLVMSVALLAVTRTVTEAERKKVERDKEIDQLLLRFEKVALQFPGVRVDKDRNAIDFGDKARFLQGSSQLSPSDAALLRTFVPYVLSIARDDLGKKWLKRVVVEGFADTTGDYLLNLNLSLQRSQRVLCALLDPPPKEGRLSSAEMEQIRDIFFVGGYSYNSAKRTLEESRRIELRLEFYSIDDLRANKPDVGQTQFGSCRI